jgi:hypothetical protein
MRKLRRKVATPRYFLSLSVAESYDFAEQTLLLCEKYKDRLQEIVNGASDSDKQLFRSALNSLENQIQRGSVT